MYNYEEVLNQIRAANEQPFEEESRVEYNELMKDFVIDYNERQKEAEKAHKRAEKRKKKRKASQNDINAFFG